MLKKIVSGGQTGVDRAALSAAIDNKIPHAGWCPKGRRAEDGVIDKKFQLQETPSSDYKERTRWNIKDSDGTLILLIGQPTGGTKLTIEIADQLGKSLLVIDMSQKNTIKEITDWLDSNHIETLNVAGPRESKLATIYDKAYELIDRLCKAL